jgi:hypothetical protein
LEIYNPLENTVRSAGAENYEAASVALASYSASDRAPM